MSITVPSDNARLSLLVGEAYHQTYTARNEADLARVLQQINAFGGPLYYDNSGLYCTGSLAVAVAVGLALLCYRYKEKIILTFCIALTAFMIFILGVGCFGEIESRSLYVNGLADAIILKHATLANNLCEDRIAGMIGIEYSIPSDFGKPIVSHDSDSEQICRKLDDEFLRKLYIYTDREVDLLKHFHEFHRGHARIFGYLYHGITEGSNGFHYIVYELMYTRTSREGEAIHVRDGNFYVTRYGGGESREIKLSFKYRYGIIVPFQHVRNVSILGYGAPGIPDKTDHTGPFPFGGRYKLYTQDGNLSRRFMKPEVVGAFKKIEDVFSGLNLEFNAKGELCMSFEEDPLAVARRTSLDDFDAFVAEVQQAMDLPKLNKALEFIKAIRASTDVPMEAASAASVSFHRNPEVAVGDPIDPVTGRDHGIILKLRLGVQLMMPEFAARFFA